MGRTGDEMNVQRSYGLLMSYSYQRNSIYGQKHSPQSTKSEVSSVLICSKIFRLEL